MLQLLDIEPVKLLHSQGMKVIPDGIDPDAYLLRRQWNYAVNQHVRWLLQHGQLYGSTVKQEWRGVATPFIPLALHYSREVILSTEGRQYNLEGHLREREWSPPGHEFPLTEFEFMLIQDDNSAQVFTQFPEMNDTLVRARSGYYLVGSGELYLVNMSGSSYFYNANLYQRKRVGVNCRQFTLYHVRYRHQLLILQTDGYWYERVEGQFTYPTLHQVLS